MKKYNTKKNNCQQNLLNNAETKKIKNIDFVNLMVAAAIEKESNFFIKKEINGVQITDKKIKRVEECANFIVFKSSADKSLKSLHSGNFCHDRLCPICSWLQARKKAYELLVLLDFIKIKYQYEFIFLTLTAPNVPADKLKNEINDFNKSFERLTKSKEFTMISNGFIRKLEITYNAEKDTYHPHFHVIVAVNKSYFKSRNYLSREKFLELWKRSKRDNTITQVDVKKVKMNSIKEVMEIATYSAKHKDILTNGKEVFSTFYSSLYKKKIFAYSGIFKEVKKLFDDDEIELEELENLKDNLVEVDRIIEYLFNQNLKKYEERKEIILSEEDIKKIINFEKIGIKID